MPLGTNGIGTPNALIQSEMDFFTDNWAYATLFFSLVAVGFTGIMPPSKPIYVSAGIAVGSGILNFWLTLCVCVTAHTLGCLCQYKAALNGKTTIVDKLVGRFGSIVEESTSQLRSGGLLTIIAFKILDPMKIFVGAAAGLAEISANIVIPAFIVGNLIYALILLFIGIGLATGFNSSLPFTVLITTGIVVFLAFIRKIHIQMCK